MEERGVCFDVKATSQKGSLVKEGRGEPFGLGDDTKKE